MLSVWTKNEKDREALERDLKRAEAAFERLDHILSEKEKDALKAFPKDYVSSGWAYQAADCNGYRRAIQEVRKIIKQE